MPVTITPSADYYADEELHGNYQYIYLSDIVDNYIMSTNDDDFASDVPRYKVLFQARRAFRELYFDAIQEIKGIALELSPQLTITLPPDYVNYVRISWLDDKGQLHPMSVNNKDSVAANYLQSHDWEILFDDEGCALESYNEGLDVDPITGEALMQPRETVSACRYQISDNFKPNKNFANVYGNGSYVVDKNNGFIRFSSDVFGKHVVLEYISDGLYTGCEGSPEAELRIHKFAEDSVYNWIYWKLIERRINVPANAKQLARKEWFNSRRICKRRIRTLRADELRQTFKGANKWIKGT